MRFRLKTWRPEYRARFLLRGPGPLSARGGVLQRARWIVLVDEQPHTEAANV